MTVAKKMDGVQNRQNISESTMEAGKNAEARGEAAMGKSDKTGKPGAPSSMTSADMPIQTSETSESDPSQNGEKGKIRIEYLESDIGPSVFTEEDEQIFNALLRGAGAPGLPDGDEASSTVLKNSMAQEGALPGETVATGKPGPEKPETGKAKPEEPAKAEASPSSLPTQPGVPILTQTIQAPPQVATAQESARADMSSQMRDISNTVADRIMVSADPGATHQELRLSLNRCALEGTEVRFRQIGGEMQVMFLPSNPGNLELLRQEGSQLSAALRERVGNDVKVRIVTSIGDGQDGRDDEEGEDL